MALMIGDYFTEKEIGKGQYSSIYLSGKKNVTTKYIMKKYERKQIDNSTYKEYLFNSIKISQYFNHPNIIKIKDIKITNNHYYIIYEYCNGGNLSYILEKYQQKNVYSFHPLIVQHLMRQIVQAFIYIHKLGLIHRNITLKNIFVHFDNEQDRANLNLMKATVKISGLKNCIKSNKKLLTQGIFDPNQNPSQKNDIFNLGIICYQMIFGNNYAINNDMEQFINDIEKGKIYYPITLSKEMLSFLKCMLRNNLTKILKIDELYNHEFLKKDLRRSQPIIRPASHTAIKNMNHLNNTSNGHCFSYNIYNKRK